MKLEKRIHEGRCKKMESFHALGKQDHQGGICHEMVDFLKRYDIIRADFLDRSENFRKMGSGGTGSVTAGTVLNFRKTVENFDNVGK